MLILPILVTTAFCYYANASVPAVGGKDETFTNLERSLMEKGCRAIEQMKNIQSAKCTAEMAQFVQIVVAQNCENNVQNVTEKTVQIAKDLGQQILEQLNGKMGRIAEISPEGHAIQADVLSIINEMYSELQTYANGLSADQKMPEIKALIAQYEEAKGTFRWPLAIVDLIELLTNNLTDLINANGKTHERIAKELTQLLISGGGAAAQNQRRRKRHNGNNQQNEISVPIIVVVAVLVIFGMMTGNPWLIFMAMAIVVFFVLPMLSAHQQPY